MSNYASFSVTFVGDYFSLTHFVELDLDEPSFTNLDDEQLEHEAVEMAKKNLAYHYGWDLDKIYLNEITVEVDYSPIR